MADSRGGGGGELGRLGFGVAVGLGRVGASGFKGPAGSVSQADTAR